MGDVITFAAHASRLALSANRMSPLDQWGLCFLRRRDSMFSTSTKTEKPIAA